MNKFLIATKRVMLMMSMVGIVYADNDPLDYSLLKSWTGYYVGVDAGFLFNDVQLKSQQLGFTNPSEECNASSDFSTFFPGIQLGYAYQFRNEVVLGIETNATFNTHQKDTLNCICPTNLAVSDHFSFRNQMQSSIKGRVGRSLNWNKNTFLPYFTAGASFARVGLTYNNEGGDDYSNKTTQAGWLVGTGVEWAFRQHWSLRAEYYYADYGNTIDLDIPRVYGLIDPHGHANVDLNTNNILVGVNYWI